MSAERLIKVMRPNGPLVARILSSNLIMGTILLWSRLNNQLLLSVAVGPCLEEKRRSPGPRALFQSLAY
jgi:hypothetical protein